MFPISATAAALLLAAAAASAQTAPPPAFEVASVKSAAPCCAPGQWRESRVEEDRLDFRYVTLRYCVAFAWRLKEYQVSGPGWLGELRYDLVAKAPAGTRRDQLPEMMQSLLAERFKLQAHREMREFNVYVLSVGKNGPKLKESPPDPDAAPGASFNIGMSSAGVGRIEVRRGNMTSLANTLARFVGRPVIDRTGLAARYDFDLECSREELSGVAPPAPAGGLPAPESAVSIFTSLQQFGLRLDARKPPLEAIVVDRAEKISTEN